MTLIDQLPTDADPDALFEAFSSWAEERGISLYPGPGGGADRGGLRGERDPVHPTGSGKSLVAAGAHFAALARDEVTFYTAPIKALVSEKFFDLCKLFGTENVGMLTGDASVNADAPVICCTAEVLASIALRDGADADIGQVVMDEFHFYAEPDRGWAWQIPLLELPQAQFVLMSATLGDVARFEEDLTRRTGRPTAVVRSATRPGAAVATSTGTTPLHRDADRAAGDPAGAGLHRALHPGRGGGAGAGADEHQHVHARGEGRDRRADRQLPLHHQVRPQPVPLRPARHRRAPRGHAAEVPAAGGDGSPRPAC